MWSCNMEKMLYLCLRLKEEAGRAWFGVKGRRTHRGNVVLGETATPWLERVEVK